MAGLEKQPQPLVPSPWVSCIIFLQRENALISPSAFSIDPSIIKSCHISAYSTLPCSITLPYRFDDKVLPADRNFVSFSFLHSSGCRTSNSNSQQSFPFWDCKVGIPRHTSLYLSRRGSTWAVWALLKQAAAPCSVVSSGTSACIWEIELSF